MIKRKFGVIGENYQSICYVLQKADFKFKNISSLSLKKVIDCVISCKKENKDKANWNNCFQSDKIQQSKLVHTCNPSSQ